MDNESVKAPSAGICSSKQVLKFCLTYFTVLIILSLIFTAINTEKMTKTQEAWRWGFVASCIISGSMCAATLLILIYTDLYQSSSSNSNQDVEENLDVLKLPVNADNSQSSSFKTVMTINSSPNTADMSAKQLNFALAQLDENRLPAIGKVPEADKFLTLGNGPMPKSPVTVVDMPAMNAKRKRINRRGPPNRSPGPGKGFVANKMSVSDLPIESEINYGANKSPGPTIRKDKPKRQKKVKKKMLDESPNDANVVS